MGNESEWRPSKQPLSAQIKLELQNILQHLGADAPDRSTRIVPEVNRDGVIRFVTPTEVYSLAGDFVVRFRPLPDGNEDVSFWRDGVQIRHFIGPRTGE